MNKRYISIYIENIGVVFRPGEIDVHVDVSSKSVSFKPGKVYSCELVSDDCGEFDLLIELMKDLENRRTTLRDVLLWIRRPHFNGPTQVVFLDQELDEVTVINLILSPRKLQ